MMDLTVEEKRAGVRRARDVLRALLRGDEATAEAACAQAVSDPEQAARLLSGAFMIAYSVMQGAAKI